jgi:hypothetical protein
MAARGSGVRRTDSWKSASTAGMYRAYSLQYKHGKAYK